MATTFNCPACGGPLEYTRGIDMTIRCPYCHNTVVVPDELRVNSLSNAALPLHIRSDTRVQAEHPIDMRALETEIRTLLAARKKIEAIKRFRQVTGVGLKDAKDTVEMIEAGGTLDARRLEIQVNPAPSPQEEASAIAQATQLILGGNKIAAIRILRSQFDLSLKVAKDAADMMESGQTVDIEWLKMKASQAATPNVYPALKSPKPGARNYFLWICFFVVLLVMIIILMTVVK